MQKNIKRRRKVMQKDAIEKAAERALARFGKKMEHVAFSMADMWDAAFAAGAKWSQRTKK